MSETIKLSFDDGYRNIEINGDPNKIIRINPTDINFLKRIAGYDETAKRIQDKYGDVDMNSISDLKNMDESNPDFEKFKTAAENIDKLENAMREMINEIFGYDISSIVFGTDSCLTPANGQPIFINFIESITAYIKQESAAESEKSQTKIAKYTDAAKTIKPMVAPDPKPATQFDLSKLTPEQIALMDYLKNNPGAMYR